MNALSSLKPERVFYYFEKLSQIPRPSGQEEKAAEYCAEVAHNLSLFVKKDAHNNVIIRKNGTFGLENSPTVILQGHLDMVCEKNAGTVHNFETDPLDLYIDGDFIKARGTTLGADNGIAVALCLAILESSDIKHPPLEVIFTTEEEVGLIGATALDPTDLTGSYVINVDTEEEGHFICGCAGGVRVDVSIPVHEDKCALPAYKLSVKGLKGGHSGMDIDKGRGNANKILGRILYELSNHVKISIAAISGGLKDNAIPREAEAIFTTNDENTPKINKIIQEMSTSIKKEFRVFDADIHISLESAEYNGKVLDEISTKNVILSLNLIKNGIFAMCSETPEQVETSSNLGKIRLKNDNFVLTSAVRSNISSRKKSLVNGLKCVADVFNGNISLRGDYPAWEVEPNDSFRNKFSVVYEELYGKKPVIATIHAGLEPACFAEKINAEMISIGPNMFDVHTPDERLSISSVQRFWEFFVKVLGTLK